MQLHELKPTQRAARAKRIGRGGKRGKTSGRGHKGQLARAGNSTRPEIRDMIKKLPKLRGHGVNRARTVNDGRVQPSIVNVSALQANFTAGATVSPQSLVQKGVLAGKGKRGFPTVKILGHGDVSIALTVKGCAVSSSAEEKITAAGGKVV